MKCRTADRKGLPPEDIFLDEEYDVCERSGSQNAQRGDIVFARVIQVDAVAMLAGAGAHAVSAES